MFEGIRVYETANGPAVFRLSDHLKRLENSARLYMELPHSVEELRIACHDVVAANGLAECYLRPIAFYGYGELGVNPGSNPVDVYIMSWPWGTYLGDEVLENGIRAKVSSWQRIGPNTIPHVAKATGIYLNSMLAVLEATRAGYDEAILLTDDGYVADGSGENIFVIKDEILSTPDLSASILPGIARQTVMEIAHSLGYAVHERQVIRSDLYIADELFMCGTAAEVTPIRSVDDHEIGPPGPSRRRSNRRSSTSCAAATIVGRAGSVRREDSSDAGFLTKEIPLSAPYIGEREEELVLDALRPGGLRSGR